MAIQILSECALFYQITAEQAEVEYDVLTSSSRSCYILHLVERCTVKLIKLFGVCLINRIDKLLGFSL